MTLRMDFSTLKIINQSTRQGKPLVISRLVPGGKFDPSWEPLFKSVIAHLEEQKIAFVAKDLLLEWNPTMSPGMLHIHEYDHVYNTIFKSRPRAPKKLAIINLTEDDPVTEVIFTKPLADLLHDLQHGKPQRG